MELAEAEQYAVASLFALALHSSQAELQPYASRTPWGEPAGLEGDYTPAALAALGPETLEAWWGFDLVAVPGGLLDSVLLRLGVPEQRWRGLHELPALVAAGGPQLSGGGGGGVTPALRTLVRSLVEVLDPGLASALPPLCAPAPATRAETAAAAAEPLGAGSAPPSSPPSPVSPPPPRAVPDEHFAGLLCDSEGDEDWEADLALHLRQASVRRAASEAAAGSSPPSRGASREVRELLDLASPYLGSAGLAGLEKREKVGAAAAVTPPQEQSSRKGSPGSRSRGAAEEKASPRQLQQQEKAACQGGGSGGEVPLSAKAVAAMWELVRCCVGAVPPLPEGRGGPAEDSNGGITAVRRPVVQWYDARARVALRLVASWLQVPWRKVAALEVLMGSDRDPAVAIAGSTAAAADPGDEGSRKMRYLQVGAAALGGGALFALTGGLAAPAIAAGMGSVLSFVPGTAAVAGGVSGFLASTSGVAVTAGTMGTAGAASTGSKMAHRTAEISEFGFLEVAAGGADAEDRARPRMDGSGEAGGAKAAEGGLHGKAGEGEAAGGEGGEPETHSAGLWNSWFGGKGGGPDGEKEAPLLLALQRSRSDADVRLSVFLGVSGWVTAAPGDFAAPWAGVAPPDAEAYALAWESRELLGLSRAVGALLVQQAAGQGASFAVSHFFYAGAGLVAALGPTLLLGTATGLLIENAWAVAMERAAKAGKLLARVLLAGGAGGRPVTLVGHGMGARLIWFALLELSRQGARGVVQDCCLLGAPVTIAPVRWSLARGAVAGRLVNGYCRTDAVLGVCYGGSTGWMRAAAGLAPVEGVPGVENADLSRLVEGHLGYLEALPEVLDCLGFSQ